MSAGKEARWEQTFSLMEKTGNPSKLFASYPGMTFTEKRKVWFNIPAFLFGLFYYIYLGMWRKALVYFGFILASYFITSFLFGAVLGILFGSEAYSYVNSFDSLWNIIETVWWVVFAVRVNSDYYKKVKLSDEGWL